MKVIFAFLSIAGVVAACGTSDDTSKGDASVDSAADVRPDREIVDAAVPDTDTPDTLYVPPTCDPNADGGDPCGAARKCCPVGDGGVYDGAIMYGCIFVKPPNDFCP